MKLSSGAFRRWQKRYFVVAGHYLKYGSSKQAAMTEPKATIDLHALTQCSLELSKFLRLCFVDGMVLELQADEPMVAADWHELLMQFAPKDDEHKPSKMQAFDHYAPKKGTKIFERKSSSGSIPAPASAPAPVPAPVLSPDTASGAGQKTIEPALSDVLGCMDVKEYSARFLDEGYDKLADVRDLTVEELITDIGMKKGHARRLAKHLAALPK